MKGEIDKDFYCTSLHVMNGGCEPKECYGYINGVCEGCPNKHRKHPTPEQYQQEYGEDVPETMPVWSLFYENGKGELTWELWPYWQHKQIAQDLERLDKDFGADPEPIPCVIACTPFPKPDDKWRPEK